MRLTRLALYIAITAWLLSGWQVVYSMHEPQAEHAPYFFYDRADQVVPATMLEGSEFYDPSILAVDDRLEFLPGQGDELWIGSRRGDSWEKKQRISRKPGLYARPTLTLDASGQLWLSYEGQNPDDRQWDVFIQPVGQSSDIEAAPGGPVRISPGTGNDINHGVAADPQGGVWIAWQGDHGGQFDIFARRISSENDRALAEEIQEVSYSPLGDWHPAIAVTADGSACIVWDTYDGQSFEVVSRRHTAEGWTPVTAVATGPAFQGRAQIAADRQGRTWVLWEEGSTSWGNPFRGKARVWTNITDSYGPLHRFRSIRLALLESDGSVRQLAAPLPMPSFSLGRQRENRRSGVEHLGVFYERGLMTVDQHGRVWVIYRHFYEPQVGQDEPTEHHIEQGWKLYARCLDGDGWSELYAFDIHQRDGMQRLSVTPQGSGLTAAWTTGRTDRREDPRPRGIAVASLKYHAGAMSQPSLLAAQSPKTAPVKSRPAAPPQPAQIGGTNYHLYYGDLHRHTDLSLCFPFYDGSLDDAYRYAIEVAQLDFLGITDHTRDINHGNALSQLWWRSTKEVRRHRLGQTFFPYFAFERSHRDTDHNVISLRGDMLRNFPPPLPEFWKELDENTFTIPHNPINDRAWNYQNDALRPLLEIYQGFRDENSQEHAHDGLDKGYHLGFIASSDHLSTSASFACVWAPDASRESIFRSMQARRTFGATDKIRLIFRSGDHWMGERFSATETPEFQIEIDGTANIASIQVYQDGKVIASLPAPGNRPSIRTTFRPNVVLTGSHYFYIHMRQVDGNQSWSSPLFVDAVPPE